MLICVSFLYHFHIKEMNIDVFYSILADEDEWRTAIKQQLEQELDRRVREALETPPLSTNR